MTFYAQILSTENFEPRPLRPQTYFFGANEAGNKHTTYFQTEGPEPDFTTLALRVRNVTDSSEICLRISDGDNHSKNMIAFIKIPVAAIPKNKKCTRVFEFFNIRMYSQPKFVMILHYDTRGSRKFECDEGEFNEEIFEECYKKQKEIYEKSREEGLKRIHERDVEIMKRFKQKLLVKKRQLEKKKEKENEDQLEEEDFSDDEWDDVPTAELCQNHTFPQFRPPDQTFVVEEINLHTIAPELNSLRSKYVPPPNVTFRPPTNSPFYAQQQAPVFAPPSNLPTTLFSQPVNTGIYQ